MSNSSFETKIIISLSDLIREVQSQAQSEDTFIYRGQRDETWEVSASFDRFVDGRVTKREKRFQEHFASFKRQLFEHYSYSDKTNYYALAQHYGLYTRLIDWSYKPFTALFFASKECATGRCALYSLNKSKFEQAVSENSFEFVHSHNNENARIVAQSGLLVHNKSDFSSLERYLEAQADIDEPLLYKYILGQDVKDEVNAFLATIGLDYHALFPDIDHLTADINYRLLHDK